MMRRREFITLLGGAAAVWPIAARSQQPSVPVIGLLDAGSPETNARLVTAFRKGLNEIGFVEGQTVTIEYRWAHNENDRLSELAADLVRRHVAAIVTTISTPAALAAKAATTTIPIVFGTGVDPVKMGLVASLNQPGGNITGVTIMNVELAAKRLGLLHDLLPQASRFAVLVNPKNLIGDVLTADIRAAGSALGLQIDILSASTNHEIDAAFASLTQNQPDAVMISPDTLFVTRLVQLITLTTRRGIPTMYPWREAAQAGGLMSYGTDLAAAYRQIGVYAGQILKGKKPAELPVLRPTKFEFVINLQTAKTLGIDVPATLAARADEVIE
jgi:putative tryptophan/tyrosine transport system substrate-binding protein